MMAPIIFHLASTLTPVICSVVDRWRNQIMFHLQVGMDGFELVIASHLLHCLQYDVDGKVLCLHGLAGDGDMVSK